MIPTSVIPTIAPAIIKAYAAHSYLYYVKDSPVISDEDYDALCRWIVAHYDFIKPSDTNGYLDLDQLKCGSGYAVAPKVCGWTKDYAESLLKPAGVFA